jgi:hypothetical protein
MNISNPSSVSLRPERSILTAGLREAASQLSPPGSLRLYWKLGSMSIGRGLRTHTKSLAAILAISAPSIVRCADLSV